MKFPISKEVRATVLVPLLAVVLAACIFVLDLMTPLGWADGFLYLIPLILILFRSPRHSHLIGFAALSSGLIILGWLLSPTGGTVAQVTYNRTMGIAMLWVTALFLRRRKNVEKALYLSQEQLESRIEERTAQFRKVIGLLKSEIAEREKAEAALRESQERLRLLIDHANDAIFFIDLNGEIQWANRQAMEITGLESVEMPGRSLLTVLSPAAAAQAEARLAAVRQGEAVPPLVELEFLRSDGSTVFVEASIASVRREGKVVGRLIVARDTTERKRAEEAMWESRQRMELALNGAELGLWDIHVPTGHVVYNQQWAQMLGYTIEDIQPHVSSWEKLTHPDDWLRVSALWNAHLAGDTVLYQADHRLRAKSGEWKWIQTYGKVLERDHDGRPLRALGIHLDITERKQVEEALRESEQQLRRALDERERLSQDLHDNVMQTIYAIGLGLEECWRIAQKGAPLIGTKMKEAIGDLNALIQDIRSYIIGVEPTVSGGIQLAKELSRLIQATGRCDTLGFHLKLDSMALQRLSGEQAGHILYIAREAISNSLRHSRGQSGTLSLWMLGDTVRFEVRDDGVGFIGDAARSQGHGLRNIAARVEKLGGILRVTSEPGNGVGIVVDILLERERVAF